MRHSRQEKRVNATFGARNTPLMLLSSHEKAKPLLSSFLAPSHCQPLYLLAVSENKHFMVIWTMSLPWQRNSVFMYLCWFHLYNWEPLDVNEGSNNLLWANVKQGTYRVFFFTGPPQKKTKSKIVLEYPDWASPGLPKNVKVHEVGLPWYTKFS